MSSAPDCESVNNVNHEREVTKPVAENEVLKNSTISNSSVVHNDTGVKPGPPPDPPARPISNHVGYSEPAQAATVPCNNSEPIKKPIEYHHQSSRIHHQERSSRRSHLRSGDKIIESRNRRRSFAGESSLERDSNAYTSRENVGSTSKLYDETAKYGGMNSYDGTSVPSYEKRTSSMGRRESYGDERRRFREQSYNGDSPVLRRNVSYGSNMENYGMYENRGFERVSRRDIQEGMRGRHNLPGRHYDPTQDPGGVRREIYQDIARRYERSQSASRLGYTEGGGHEVYPQRCYGMGYQDGYGESVVSDMGRRYSEAPGGMRDQAPPYYAAPRPGMRYEMPRYQGPPMPQQYPVTQAALVGAVSTLTLDRSVTPSRVAVCKHARPSSPPPPRNPPHRQRTRCDI
ncbi:hypothetical protein J6590_020591 [Homalodisca vitripennis]|nr:hypothetical protein J6590_020591 [Homalodisca vitripennis]